MTVEELIDNFQWLEDWEERYRYIIDLGRKLEPMPEKDKNEVTKVEGCMSQVWMTGAISGTPPTLHIVADSDAFIVKGLIAVLLIIYNGKSPEEILNTDIKAIFSELDLEGHISPNRRNGFYAMVGRIQSFAKTAS